MRLLLLCVCVAAAVAAPVDQWHAYRLTYSKVYDAGEIEFRHQIFQKTLDFIEKHNEEAGRGLHSYTVGINDMSDWTDEEYQHLLGARKVDQLEEAAPSAPVEVGGPIAAAIDWRDRLAVTPVKDQGQCGSCWAYGATGSIEAVCKLKKGTLYDLSEQQLVDCSRSYGNYGCGGGWHQNAYKYIKDAGGIVETRCYIYEARDAPCRFPQARHCIACKLTGYKSSGSEAGMARDLNTVGTIGVAIDAGRSGFRNYRSGIYDDKDCSKRSNHVVLAVGYDANSWIVKNSWGLRWGDKGYILMKRGYNICGIEKDAHYPTM